MTDQEYDLAIARTRNASERRRSEEWSVIPERVLGLPLRPITPATFALLSGTGNAFVFGLPPTIGDVNDYILFHSPEFDPDSPRPRFWQRLKIAWRTSRALCPLRTPKNRRSAVAAENFFRAVIEIRAIIHRTWGDALPPSGEDNGPSVAAAFTAALLDTFASDYHYWPLPQPLRHSPVTQLFQLRRCQDRRSQGERAVYFDREEDALTGAYLAGLNKDALQQDAAKKEKPCRAS